MRATIKLFKAIPIATKRKKKPTKELLEYTLKRGFAFSPEVIYNHKIDDKLLNTIEAEIGITPEKLNNSFHKSWNKVKTASMLQLVHEQILHYFTTYGFEHLGIYDKDSVYIPHEKLDIPEVDSDGVNITIIKGYTKEELKAKLIELLSTGIALGEDTIKDIIEVATFVEIKEEEIRIIKNKEVRIILYDYLGLFPENPTEFLRYIVYRATEKTLLIKNPSSIEMIKESSNLDVLGLFVKYKNKYGLEKLAEIFNRYKPLFLAFKGHNQLSAIINKIRKLAKKHHKPMEEDYLNAVTEKISNGNKITKAKLNEELNKVNIFRKIRLAYALKFRSKDVDSILYRIRNGKSYATSFKPYNDKTEVKRILEIILESVISDVKKNVKGKKIYIPKNMTYALPTTEKQFTGCYPSGTYITIPKDMVFGVHWENQDEHRIDLDLSLISADTGKIGWDSSYRTEDRKILFSGDITDAPKPNGATELFYIRRQSVNGLILLVNYYNHNKEVEVPFKIIVAQEKVSNLKENYMVNPNNVMSIANTKISEQQKVLGLVITTKNECRFYFAETHLGKSISSSGGDFVEHSRKYLFDFYRNTINLNDILKKSGAKFIDDKSKADIDLSPEVLEKDTIINLIK